MLKKIISIILCAAAVCCITACGGASTADTTNTELTRGTVEFPIYNTNKNGTSSGTSDFAHGDSYYYSFEEICRNFSDAVIATCKSHTINGWTFNVKEVILGNSEGTISVHIGSSMEIITSLGGNNGYDPITYRESSLHFENGETYLLMLNKTHDVYNLEEPVYYYSSCALSISLDNVSSSQMYGESAKRHITGIDIDTCSSEEMIEYVKRLLQGCESGKAHSNAQTLEEIVCDSSDVVQIKISEPYIRNENASKKTEIWKCEVIEPLKGDIQKGKFIYITFFADVVIPGKEYIVALDDAAELEFKKFITKDSLRPVSEKSEIKSYID